MGMRKDNRTKQERSMNIDNGMMMQIAKLGLLLMMGVSMSAEAGLFGHTIAGKKKCSCMMAGCC